MVFAEVACRECGTNQEKGVNRGMYNKVFRVEKTLAKDGIKAQNEAITKLIAHIDKDHKGSKAGCPACGELGTNNLKAHLASHVSSKDHWGTVIPRPKSIDSV